jgi:glycosyltransferase involved in cell wall biosynthesis
MRIAIISDLTKFNWAGCEELWTVLAESALAAGHEVAVFINRENIPPEKMRPLLGVGLKLHFPGYGARAVERARTRLSWKFAGIIAPLFQAFSALNKFAPDIVFISNGDAVPSPEFLGELERSRALAWPYVLICHNSHLFGRPMEMAMRDAAVRYYQGARCVLFVAERTRMETEHLLATALARVRIVRNPVNLTLTSEVAMPAGPTVRIASVGRLAIQSKGQDILLAALGSPELRSRDWQLSFYGTGPHVERLQLLAQHYQIAGKVAFKGYANDIRAVWADNHLLAMPSRNESAPLALVEAMLCGRPSVVNDVGGITEWVSEPETAFVSPGLRVGSFRAALERAWLARAEWPAMGLRARERALQLLDPDPGGTLLSILIDVDAERRSGIQTESRKANPA